MSCIQSPYFSETMTKVWEKRFTVCFNSTTYFHKLQMFAFFNARIGTEFQSTTINETLKELFLWSRVNEHLPTTGIFKPLYADNLTFTGWRSSLGDMFSKYSTGITLHWAPIGRFIFDMRNVNQIFRGFLKIDRIKEKFVFVSRRWFSFSLFIFVDSFSITWQHFLKWFFLLQLWKTFP